REGIFVPFPGQLKRKVPYPCAVSLATSVQKRPMLLPYCLKALASLNIAATILLVLQSSSPLEPLNFTDVQAKLPISLKLSPTDRVQVRAHLVLVTPAGP